MTDFDRKRGRERFAGIAAQCPAVRATVGPVWINLLGVETVVFMHCLRNKKTEDICAAPDLSFLLYALSCSCCTRVSIPEVRSMFSLVRALWYGLSCQRQTDVCVTRMPAIRAGNGALVNLPPEAYATDLARFLLTWSHVCFPCWSLL